MAAQNGNFVLVAMDGSETYCVDVYIPDATGTKLTFNGSGLATATSDNYWQAPVDCYLVDISGAAPTAVGAILTYTGALATNHTFRWANQLATLPTRQKHKVKVYAGTQLGALQF
jgi:hypothetical protein